MTGPAVLVLDGYGGRSEQRVEVLGETATRYRITPAGDTQVRLAGRLRWLDPGASTLVPKYAIRFLAPAS